MTLFPLRGAQEERAGCRGALSSESPKKMKRTLAEKGALLEKITPQIQEYIDFGSKKRRTCHAKEEEWNFERTRWDGRRYRTDVKLGWMQFNVYTHTLSDAIRADDLGTRAADSLNSRRTKRKRKAEKMESLSSKRKKDVETTGDNCGKERRFCLLLKESWIRRIGTRCIICNDGTRSDVLFEIDEKFLPVQVKTASERRGAAQFRHVRGYSEMPVVCWSIDAKEALLYDGAVLDRHKSCDLAVRKTGENRRLAMRDGMDVDSLIDYLSISRHWALTTEDEARSDFKSVDHRKEYDGILAYRSRFPSVPFSWPEGQNTHVDAVMGGERLQFKTVLRQNSGFFCNFTTSGGEKGKIRLPYPKGAFDHLIAVFFFEEKAHFWRIPSLELEKRGFFSSDAEAGKTGLTLFAPSSQIGTRKVMEKKCKNLWTRDFYLPQP